MKYFTEKCHLSTVKELYMDNHHEVAILPNTNFLSKLLSIE